MNNIYFRNLYVMKISSYELFIWEFNEREMWFGRKAVMTEVWATCIRCSVTGPEIRGEVMVKLCGNTTQQCPVIFDVNTSLDYFKTAQCKIQLITDMHQYFIVKILIKSNLKFLIELS